MQLQKSNVPILLVDTNVWIDLFLPDQPLARDSKEMVAWAVAHDIGLAYPSSALLDVYRSTAKWYKLWSRRFGLLSEADAIAAKRFAWDNANYMQDIASAVPVEQSDIRMAAKYRDVHNDLEDDLVLAACARSKANYLVTNDLKLIRHAPIKALTPKNMLLALKSGAAEGTPYSEDSKTASDWLYIWLSKDEVGALEL